MAKHVTLSLGGTQLLGGVDLDVRPGEVTAVLGPNGAGKTSLLRLLSGELPPDSGEVTLDDEGLHDLAHAARARRLAVLPQHSVLNFPFTAEEVAALGRTPHATGVAADRRIVASALAAVDLEHLASREYTRLSGGEKQRVQLARVLAQIWGEAPGDTRYLLLDEPTASFDLAHQRMTLEIVRRLAGEGVGVLIVLHDLNLAARCADQLVLLHGGAVAFSGPPVDVLTVESIRAVFDVDATIGRHPASGGPLVIT